jgi:hypothetical protein
MGIPHGGWNALQGSTNGAAAGFAHVSGKLASSPCVYYPGRRQVSPALAAFIEAVRVPAKTRKGR